MPQEHSVSALAIGVASALGSFVAVAVAGGLYLALTPQIATQEQSETPSCNVLGIQLHGEVVSTRASVPVSDYLPPDGSGALYTPNYAIANTIVDALDNAAADPAIKAVIVDIDSAGGSGTAAHEVTDALRRLGKPSIALIHDMGLSAGYLVASGADSIIANKTSTIGSIGVTLSYISDFEKSKNEGLEYVQLSSAPFKDMLAPSKILTDEERALAEQVLAILHSEFVSTVARFRDLPEEQVSEIADGSPMVGSDALASGLIDGLGGIAEVKMQLESALGEPVSICWQ
jgi:protease-4